MAKKLEDWLKEFNQPAPSNYVGEEYVAPKEKVVVGGDKVITSSPSGSKAIYDNTTKKALVDSAPLQVVEEVPAVQAPIAQAPVEEKPEAPKPSGNRVYSDPPVPQQMSLKQKLFAEPLPEPSAWERALVGATPLLVGLLTGNKMEGAQVAANHVIKTENKLTDRTFDLNKKLAELKLQRELASTNGKVSGKTFEYRGSDGINRIGNYVQGQRFIDEVNDPLAPIDAKSAKPNYETLLNPRTNKFEVAEILPGGEPRFLGEAQPKFRPQVEDIVDPRDIGEDGKPAEGALPVKVVLDDRGKQDSILGFSPKTERRTLSLEERMELAKYNKELKEPELKFKQTRDLNKDRESVLTTKNTRELAEAHGKIMNTTFGNDPISDVATIFSLFKMMDPGSVVRESEQALGMQARSYEDLVNNVGPMLMKQRYLTPTQVKNIRSLADKMYKQQLKIQETSVDALIKQRAKAYGLNPDEVAPPIRSPYAESKASVPKGHRAFVHKDGAKAVVPVGDSKAIKELIEDGFEEIK